MPIVVLPVLAFALAPTFPAWAFMWSMAAAVFFGCKWLTLCEARPTNLRRSLGYLFLWPGMDAKSFLDKTGCGSKPTPDQWRWGVLKAAFGAALLWGVLRHTPWSDPLVAGWIGMVGLAFLMHFGAFYLIALAWQRAGVHAEPIMRAPLTATSLGEFWGQRWNAAFNQLAHRYTFRPLVRRIGVTGATMAAFLASGLIHDLVISVPARGGYGLPTAYFLLQGVALLFERSSMGKALRLGSGGRGWLFTVACTAIPAYWLFHPPFIKVVILPFLQIIGAWKGSIL